MEEYLLFNAGVLKRLLNGIASKALQDTELHKILNTSRAAEQNR